jgi:peptidoglycan/xylan/chitin deacetylase (PgdA/CDA1 family)
MIRPTILAYHALGDCPREDDPDELNLFVSPESFEQQMAWLAAHKRVVSLDDVATGRETGRSCVAITFDDAYRNVARLALPILERHGFSATVFAPTGFIGKRNTWIGPSPCDVDIMDLEDLRMCESRGISIESHGHDHIDFAEASDELAREDLIKSREVLSDGLLKEVRHLAFPFGRSSARSRAIARELGFAAAYSIDRRHQGTFAWERVQITPLDEIRLFALKCSGAYHLLRRSRLGEAAFSLARPIVRKIRH